MGSGQLAPPGGKGAGLGFATVLLEFHQTQKQVAQGGHDVSAAPAADAREVTVRSEVELPANAGDKRSAQVDYTLIKTPTGWRVYNVSIEGASLVTIYRNNFNDILRQGGPDALIQSLKDKNDALSGGKHASN